MLIISAKLFKKMIKTKNLTWLRLFLDKKDQVILRSENKELDNAGLRSKMPINWNWGDDKFARYNKVGIEISDKKLKVSGRLIR